jgi:hypothetical protein
MRPKNALLVPVAEEAVAEEAVDVVDTVAAAVVVAAAAIAKPNLGESRFQKT